MSKLASPKPAKLPAGARSRHADPEADLKAARRVLAVEAEALAALSSALNEDFIRAIDLLAAVTGRVVATGMGKSGHVARKIAATLASTGTPAFYVHPGEASHGDLGMLTQGDAVLALSFSGETAELADLVAHTRRFRLPLVGIVGRKQSALAEQADCALVLPALTEACPMGLAPTTSTTAMLALGDAIAVALLERRGFTAADFQVLHPGGKLGQQLMRVRDLMHGGEEPVHRRDRELRHQVEFASQRIGHRAPLIAAHPRAAPGRRPRQSEARWHGGS
mgnify:CR=1 FL=1